MNLLELQNVSSGYGKLPILHGVSLEVAEGGLVALVGPNGAGKSTLCHTIAGLLPLMGGDILFEGKSIRDDDPSLRVGKGLGYTPQRRNVFTDMRVEENLQLAATFAKAPPGRVEAMYEHFPVLRERKWQKAGTLSGGERQMLALASALLPEPKLLILDEPTTGLAPRITQELVEIVGQLKEAGHTILWVVEENPRQVLRHADVVYQMEGGVITGKSAAEELLDEETFRAFFFGA